MAPTVVRDGPFRLFFFSREETRIHVHVSHPDGEAKFWLTPVVHIATSTGLNNRQLADAQVVVNRHLQEIQDAWNHHFGG
jgi:ribosomal protein L16/L10AE